MFVCVLCTLMSSKELGAIFAEPVDGCTSCMFGLGPQSHVEKFIFGVFCLQGSDPSSFADLLFVGDTIRVKAPC